MRPRPIYFYHIYRTGGRSFSRAVLSEFRDMNVVWGRCHGSRGEEVVEVEGKKIVPWHSVPPISDFFYSWSHVPVYLVRIPKRCFTITILRDPVDRFVSRARDIRKHDQLGSPIPRGDRNLGILLRKGLLSAARACLPGERLEQLYHFSPTGDVDEALETVRKISYVFRMEEYEEGLRGLRKLLGLKLPHLHCTDGDIPGVVYHDIAAQLIPSVTGALGEIFAPEYELLERLGNHPSLEEVGHEASLDIAGL